jgi:hypothetical protein
MGRAAHCWRCTGPNNLSQEAGFKEQTTRKLAYLADCGLDDGLPPRLFPKTFTLLTCTTWFIDALPGLADGGLLLPPPVCGLLIEPCMLFPPGGPASKRGSCSTAFIADDATRRATSSEIDTSLATNCGWFMIAPSLLSSSGFDPVANMARFITSITALSTAALAIVGEGCLLLSGVCGFGGVLSQKKGVPRCLWLSWYGGGLAVDAFTGSPSLD